MVTCFFLVSHFTLASTSPIPFFYVLPGCRSWITTTISTHKCPHTHLSTLKPRRRGWTRTSLITLYTRSLRRTSISSSSTTTVNGLIRRLPFQPSSRNQSLARSTPRPVSSIARRSTHVLEQRRPVDGVELEKQRCELALSRRCTTANP